MLVVEKLTPLKQNCKKFKKQLAIKADSISNLIKMPYPENKNFKIPLFINKDTEINQEDFSSKSKNNRLIDLIFPYLEKID